jgi:hypothetical protein
MIRSATHTRPCPAEEARHGRWTGSLKLLKVNLNRSCQTASPQIPVDVPLRLATFNVFVLMQTVAVKASPTCVYVDVPPETVPVALYSTLPFLQRFGVVGLELTPLRTVVCPLLVHVTVPDPDARAEAEKLADLLVFDFGVHLPRVMVPVADPAVLPQRTLDVPAAPAVPLQPANASEPGMAITATEVAATAQIWRPACNFFI